MADDTKNLIEVGIDPISVSEALTPAEVDMYVHQINTLENASSLLAGHVSKNPSTAAIIVAGGEGERFRNPGGKQLFEVLGKPVLTWSAEAFTPCPTWVSLSSCVPKSARRSTAARPSTHIRL